MKPVFKVAEVLNQYSLVINAGENHNLKINQRFLIVDPDGMLIFDPDTHERLGRLERIVGTGIVKELYPRMAILNSDMSRVSESSGTRSIINAGINVLADAAANIYEDKNSYLNYKPFDNPKIGHLAKPI